MSPTRFSCITLMDTHTHTHTHTHTISTVGFLSREISIAISIWQNREMRNDLMFETTSEAKAQHVQNKFFVFLVHFRLRPVSICKKEPTHPHRLRIASLPSLYMARRASIKASHHTRITYIFHRSSSTWPIVLNPNLSIVLFCKGFSVQSQCQPLL